MGLLKWANGFPRVSVQIPTQGQDTNETYWEEMRREMQSWTKASGQARQRGLGAGDRRESIREMGEGTAWSCMCYMAVE